MNINSNNRVLPTVCVLMSTYNGERFLYEQIGSIFRQKNVTVHLVVRDDGSVDDTVKVIESFIREGADIELIKGENLGPSESFLELIYTHRKYDYFALADQDDIWHDDKLCAAVDKMENSKNVPTLYYSSVTLVNSRGNKLPVQVSTEKATLENGIFGFYATGCTIVYNKKMADFVMRYRPKNIYMHDAWLLTVACYCGEIIFDKQSHIDYRQHESNVVGMAKKRSLNKKLRDFFLKNKGRHSKIAKELQNGFEDCISDKEIRMMLGYAAECPNSLTARLQLLKSNQFKMLPKQTMDAVGRQILFGVF